MEGKLSCGCTSKLKARGLCQKHYDVQRSLDKLIRSGDNCNKMGTPQTDDHKPVQVIPVSSAFLQNLSHKFNFKTTTHSRDTTCMLSPHIAITSSPQHQCMAPSPSPTFHLPPLCIPSVSQILALHKTSFHATSTSTTVTSTTITTHQPTTTSEEIQHTEGEGEEEECVSLPVTTISVDVEPIQQPIPDVRASTTSSTVLALILLSQSQSVDETTKKTETLPSGYKCQIDGCKKEYITIQSLVGHSIECHGMGSNASVKKRSMEHPSRPTKKQKVKIK